MPEDRWHTICSSISQGCFKNETRNLAKERKRQEHDSWEVHDVKVQVQEERDGLGNL